MNWTLRGFTYLSFASFVDNKTGREIEVNDILREKLEELIEYRRNSCE